MVFQIAQAPRSWYPKFVFASACGLVLLLGMLSPDKGDVIRPSDRLRSAFGVAIAIALAAMQRWDGPSMRLAPVRWLAWVGVFSYSLYLSHVPVVSFAARIFGRFARSVPGEVAVVLIQVTLSILVARLFYRYCEKPFLKPRASKALDGPTPASET
jgi:peptidoglycan/LPS O-acetylase OafA/YrhL